MHMNKTNFKRKSVKTVGFFFFTLKSPSEKPMSFNKSIH